MQLLLSIPIHSRRVIWIRLCTQRTIRSKNWGWTVYRLSLPRSLRWWKTVWQSLAWITSLRSVQRICLPWALFAGCLTVLWKKPWTCFRINSPRSRWSHRLISRRWQTVITMVTISMRQFLLIVLKVRKLNRDSIRMWMEIRLLPTVWLLLPKKPACNFSWVVILLLRRLIFCMNYLNGKIWA